MCRVPLILVLLLFCTGTASARIIEGIVKKVYDGDTLEMVTRQKGKQVVRLYGIDAPETGKRGSSGQPFGAVSRRTLMFKVLGRYVAADILDSDQYNRAVAVIRLSGRDINREMIEEGMAWAYRQYLKPPYTSTYIASENHARNRRKGIWRESNPVPPWEFRRSSTGKGKKHFGW